MATTQLLRQEVRTQDDQVWTITAEERSGMDHPVYAPLQPLPAPGIFLSVTNTDGLQRHFERVGDVNVLAQRVAALVAIIEAMD